MVSSCVSAAHRPLPKSSAVCLPIELLLDWFGYPKCFLDGSVTYLKTCPHTCADRGFPFRIGSWELRLETWSWNTAVWGAGGGGMRFRIMLWHCSRGPPSFITAGSAAISPHITPPTFWPSWPGTLGHNHAQLAMGRSGVLATCRGGIEPSLPTDTGQEMLMNQLKWCSMVLESEQ